MVRWISLAYSFGQRVQVAGRERRVTRKEQRNEVSAIPWLRTMYVECSFLSNLIPNVHSSCMLHGVEVEEVRGLELSQAAHVVGVSLESLVRVE